MQYRLQFNSFLKSIKDISRFRHRIFFPFCGVPLGNELKYKEVIQDKNGRFLNIYFHIALYTFLYSKDKWSLAELRYKLNSLFVNLRITTCNLQECYLPSPYHEYWISIFIEGLCDLIKYCMFQTTFKFRRPSLFLTSDGRIFWLELCFCHTELFIVPKERNCTIWDQCITRWIKNA